MTYFVKGYGYHESGYEHDFSIIFDIDEVNAESFIKAVEENAHLSPFRGDKKIHIETVVVLSK